MLVLTRRADAGHHSVIKIGDDVEIMVLEIRGDQVKIGIAAPRELAVHRAEVYEEIAAEIASDRQI